MLRTRTVALVKHDRDRRRRPAATVLQRRVHAQVAAVRGERSVERGVGLTRAQ